MKSLVLALPLALAACASHPPDVFQPTTPHKLVGWSISEDGSACPIWDLEQGITVWCGTHRIGDGPDIYDERGQSVGFVQLGDE